ncbi:MAG: carboxypeptidase regulatory-like domain-containing protein, partial [Bryobacteraceae bacterium]
MRPSPSAVVLALSMLVAMPAAAQVITGSILGNVSDPSSGAVAGAKVTARNIGTNVSTTVSTSSSGEYTLTYLPTGMYEVTIEAPAFKGFRQTNVRLGVDSKVRVDAQLTVGSVSESVEVIGTAQVLQTDSSDVSTTFSQAAIQSLPNIGRSALSYVRTVPGVITRSGFESVTNSATSDEGRRQFTNFSVNGSQPLNSEILLDGAPNTNAALNEISVLPNLDAIGDLKIITSAYSAEFGRVAGGVVIFNTKSGTNQYHGSLYEYFRNPVLNANTFGNNTFGRKSDGTPVRPKGKFNHNQF